MALSPIPTASGPVSGVPGRTPGVTVFKGIPYAAAPTGPRRWTAPQPPEPWTEVRACTRFGPSAVQTAQGPFSCWSAEFIVDTSRGSEAYSEDCLSLNVWTGPGPGHRPVLVFIHGGAYTSGGTSCDIYDGEALAALGVVVVTVNYRVGILGFLATPELSAESADGVSGNYGILDQIAALKWVQTNIAGFGGDPNNVTIQGQSAGSGSVGCLILSPRAQGLFHKAVTQSFNLIDVRMPTLAEQEARAPKVPLSKLRTMEPAELLALPCASSPTVDGVVIPLNMAEALTAGTAHDVPLLTGMVCGDAGLFGITEEGMLAQQVRLAEARAETGRSATFLYYFTHMMPGPESTRFGAFHSADVPYSLGYLSPTRSAFWQPADRDLAAQMSRCWANFARTGSPNGPGLPVWEPFRPGEVRFHELGG